MNMLNLALALGKPQALRVILTKSADNLREAIKGNFSIPSYVVRINNEPLSFNNLGMAYLVKSESLENLY